MTRSAVRHAPRQGIGNHCGPESSITARPGPPEGPGPGPPTPEAQTPGHQDSEGRRRRGGDEQDGTRTGERSNSSGGPLRHADP
ncbi:unnamed protein product [Prorocentrum cordatum]|uniref:Uncharacterized protein n=1 Tax=Prorocentrum cordatum TaxID=2364126 RepID=A0ABN9T6X8_9DINO|nr:unnamed protein product [Polarella glacialis]